MSFDSLNLFNVDMFVFRMPPQSGTYPQMWPILFLALFSLVSATPLPKEPGSHRVRKSFQSVEGPSPVVPVTSFGCSDQDFPGIYADQETNCQVQLIAIYPKTLS